MAGRSITPRVPRPGRPRSRTSTPTALTPEPVHHQNGPVSVYPDHAETDQAAPPRRPLLVVVYGALSLVLVMIIWANDSTPPTSSIPDSTPTTVDRLRPENLETLVPGLNGTLQAVSGSERFGLISWSSQGPLLVGPDLPTGRPEQIAFDATGEFFGVSIHRPASNVGTILVGGSSGFSDLGVAASSFAWHLTEPGSMAATLPAAGRDEATLVKLQVESGWIAAREPIRSVGARDFLLAWGDWGFLLREHEDNTTRVVLLDSAGNQLWSRPAHWAYAAPTGDVLLSFYNNEIREFQRVLPDSDPNDPGRWFELPSLGVTAVGWSPDGDRLAVVSHQGGTPKSRLEILDNEGNPLTALSLEWNVWDLAWDQNGRFVIMPGTREGSYAVLFYDNENGQLTPVTFDHPIQAAAMGR